MGYWHRKKGQDKNWMDRKLWKLWNYELRISVEAQKNRIKLIVEMKVRRTRRNRFDAKYQFTFVAQRE